MKRIIPPRVNIRKQLRSQIKTCSLICSFTIVGSPASSKNNRNSVSKGSFLSGEAKKYDNLFKKQIERMLPKLKNVPFFAKDLYYVFEIFYMRKTSDASIELIFDCMQRYGVITNDNIIRKHIVLADEFDTELPRTNIYIFSQNNMEKQNVILTKR